MIAPLLTGFYICFIIWTVIDFSKESKKIHKLLEEAADLLEDARKIRAHADVLRAQAKALLDRAEEESSRNAL